MDPIRLQAIELFKQELARRSFWDFCLYYDPDLFTKRPFLKDVATAFQQVTDGEIKSLSVSMPPRAGKSYVTSLFCAWTLGNNPKESVMRNTCTATLYAKFSYDTRAIVLSQTFRDVFPDVRISPDKANLQGWNTTQSKMVGYFGAGVGGTIIGFGASLLAITDDLYTGIETALNETANDKVIQWKQATHDSRMESGCRRIDIGTRWSRDDVIGYQMANNEYDKSIIVKALDDNNNSFCEAVMTTQEYLDKRNKTAKEIWLAEYQQQPVDILGRMFAQLETIEESDFRKIHKQIEGTIAYVDVSDQGKDYTAVAIAGVIKDKIYIVDYLFTKDNTDVTIPLTASLMNKWNVSYCRVESNSMGAMFSRDLQRQVSKTKILQVHNTTNKLTRILMQSAFILQKMTFVLYRNSSCRTFLENTYTFSKEGKNKNDDAPDCLAGLSMFTQSMFKSLRY
jgi:predicted phage terminase large subunit-like protein